MSTGTKYSDEQVLSALLTSGSVRGASDLLGLSRSALYRRLREPAFKARYNELQGAILNDATSAMADTLTDAVRTLRAICNDSGANDSSRISAADSLLRHALRYIEATAIISRIETIENTLQELGGNYAD